MADEPKTVSLNLTDAEISAKLNNVSLEETETPLAGLVRSNQLRPGQEDAEIKIQAEGVSPYESKKSFEEFGLRPEILKGIYAMNYNKPSRIQEYSIPNILANPPPNFIGQAQSGSGKTAAFAVGMIVRSDETLEKPQALCICPTRELAKQIFEVTTQLCQFTKLKVTLVVKETDGARPIKEQIIIGTPGRVVDLIQKQKIETRNIKVFCLDEADQMIAKQGFGGLTTKIKERLPQGKTQILLFSATFAPEVQQYANQMVPQPRVQVLLKPEELSVERLEQLFIDCKDINKKFAILNEMFAYLSVGQTIIFVRTKRAVDMLHASLTKEGHQVSRIHGEMEPEERDQVMKDFRDGKARVLVCTDILARGIDVLQVSLVINFDLPYDGQSQVSPEVYLHRIGRSARYGAPGIAVNFVHDAQTRRDLHTIESHFKKQIRELKEEEIETLDTMLKKIEHLLRKK